MYIDIHDYIGYVRFDLWKWPQNSSADKMDPRAVQTVVIFLDNTKWTDFVMVVLSVYCEVESRSL